MKQANGLDISPPSATKAVRSLAKDYGTHRTLLTLKAPNEIAADDILFLYFYLSKEIRLDVSCESSA